MPALTRSVLRGKIQVLFEELMLYLYESVEFSGKIDVYRIGGEEIPCLAAHSYTTEVVRWMTTQAELDDNMKGGEMYEFYRQLRPEKMKDSFRLKWQDQKGMVKLSEGVMLGVLRIFKKHRLDRRVQDFRQLETALQDMFADRKLISESKKPLDESVALMKRLRILLRADRFPQAWVQSVWKLYERTDVGICESFLSFKRKGDLIAVEMKTIYRHAGESTAFRYEGLAGRDEGNDYLIVQLFRVDPPYTYASLILRVDDYNSERQMASVAHYSYYAIRFRKYITKQVVAERTSLSVASLPAAREVYRKNRKEFMEISPFVRRYLNSRVHNRLSMPSQVITHLEKGDNSLRAWVNLRISPGEIDHRLKQCYGAYKLVYLNQQQKPVELDFAIDAEDKTLDVGYSRSAGLLTVANVRYQGELSIASANILQGTLVPMEENPNRMLVGSSLARLFLMLKVPVTQSPAAFKDQFTRSPLTGLLSGLPDEVGNQPMCVRCILLLKEVKVSEEILRKLKSGNFILLA